MLKQSWQTHSVSETARSGAVRYTPRRALRLRGLISGLLVSLIRVYQKAISPLLAPHCRFHPTCSTYARQAITDYGPLGGSVRALARLARCHPLAQGGYDPVR